VKWRSSISGNDLGVVISGLGDGDVLRVPVSGCEQLALEDARMGRAATMCVQIRLQECCVFGLTHDRRAGAQVDETRTGAAGMGG